MALLLTWAPLDSDSIDYLIPCKKDGFILKTGATTWKEPLNSVFVPVVYSNKVIWNMSDIEMSQISPLYLTYQCVVKRWLWLQNKVLISFPVNVQMTVEFEDLIMNQQCKQLLQKLNTHFHWSFHLRCKYLHNGVKYK